jgi:uncharacterized protein (TIGR02145 family)
MKRVLTYLLLLSIVFLFACGDNDPTAPAGTTLSGKVSIKSTGALVSGAKVSLGDIETTSDENGNYLLANVTSVEQNLRAEKSNYAVYIEKFTAVKGDNTVDIELETYSEYCTRITSVIYQGKTYNTVLINNQCWFKDNLNAGTQIDDEILASNDTRIEKYCYRNSASYCTNYGGLYLWHEAMNYIQDYSNQGICPNGWHIPTLDEVQILIDYVNDDGNALKTEGIGEEPFGMGTNTSGFTGLFGGSYDEYATINDAGEFQAQGDFGAWWTSTLVTENEAQYLGIYARNPNIFWGARTIDWGKSIRCLKD